MTLDMKNKTVSLNVVKAEKQAKVDEETSSFIQGSIDSIKEILENEPDSKGLIALVFNKDNDPKIVWGGDIDYIKMIGALDVAKLHFTSILMSDTYIQDEE
jgi:hypothetical protein